MEVIQGEQAEVKQLFKQPTSKWDVKLKDHTIKLKIDPCGCGVHARWVVTRPAASRLPREIQVLMGPQLEGKMIEETLEEFHWEPKWTDRILFRSMKNELQKWIHKHHKDFLEIPKKEAEAQELRNLVETL
jgi:hypothetical protein